MGKRELARLLGKLRGARDAADWHGKFTQEIREATKLHRFDNIAAPLAEVISALQLELNRLDRKEKRQHRSTRAYRAPYKDD